MSEHDQDATGPCSFCSKGVQQVNYLVAGPGVNICDECVDVCVAVIRDRAESTAGNHEKRPAKGAAWGAGGASVICALCQMPAPVSEALLVEGKGALCRACVAEVDAATATAAWAHLPKRP